MIAHADNQALKVNTREKAVAAALRWLANHQQKDGGWALEEAPDGGHKVAESSTEATGLALLAFLAANQSHAEGDYKKNVHAGLAFLIKQAKVDDHKADLQGLHGDMISHAIAARALSESYAATKDKELLAPAQMAVKFIIEQQDEQSGAWKVDAMAKPSVEATGWQVQALQSAHMSYLEVKVKAVLSAKKFLDSAQLEKGSAYPGINGEREHRATAVGLYSRWMLGWKCTEPAMVAGLAAVGRGGPQKHDTVANYFAHQLHKACLGESWKRWNEAISKQLLQSQVLDGNHAGSWYDPEDRSAAHSGRLLQTAINAMILEIYPSLKDMQRAEADDEFPL